MMAARPSVGRRFRDARSWSIPYVDDDQLVIKALSTGSFTAATLSIAFFLEFVGSVSDGFVTARDLGLTQAGGILEAVGWGGAVYSWLSVAQIRVDGIYRSARINSLKKLVAERRLGSIRATIDTRESKGEVEIEPLRGIVHATLYAQSFVFLLLGDRVLEAWRTYPRAGGGSPERPFDWKEEILSGGEGSAPVGDEILGSEAESGTPHLATSPDERLSPVTQALRKIYGLPAEMEWRAKGPEGSLRSMVTAAALAIGVPGLGGLVFFYLPAALRMLISKANLGAGDPQTKLLVCLAAGAAVGVVLVGIQKWLVNAWLDANVVPRVDAFFDKLFEHAQGSSRKLL